MSYKCCITKPSLFQHKSIGKRSLWECCTTTQRVNATTQVTQSNVASGKLYWARSDRLRRAIEMFWVSDRSATIPSLAGRMLDSLYLHVIKVIWITVLRYACNASEYQFPKNRERDGSASVSGSGDEVVIAGSGLFLETTCRFSLVGIAVNCFAQIRQAPSGTWYKEFDFLGQGVVLPSFQWHKIYMRRTTDRKDGSQQLPAAALSSHHKTTKWSKILGGDDWQWHRCPKLQSYLQLDRLYSVRGIGE
jgi:hypothetical protein